MKKKILRVLVETWLSLFVPNVNKVRDGNNSIELKMDFKMRVVARLEASFVIRQNKKTKKQKKQKKTSEAKAVFLFGANETEWL